jgi:polysaccharide biosynthesis transport protein
VERDNAISLQDYLAVLRRQRALIALVATFAALGGALWFVLQTPIYEAHAELALERVRAAQDVSLDELLNPSGNVRVSDLAGATSPAVAQAATESLGREDPTQLRNQVRAEAVLENQVLRITAADADPAAAAAIADAFATAFIEYRRQEAVDAVLLAQAELDQRASELRAEISAVNAQIAALDIPGLDFEEQPGGAEEQAEILTDDEGGATGETEPEPRREPSVEELDEFETLQIRREALRSQLTQVFVRSTELGESADALTGFAAEFTRALVPSTPVGRTMLEVVALSLLVGLGLGLALAFVRDYFDDVIRDEDDFKQTSEGRPVLGRIPLRQRRDHDAERVASLIDPASPVAEAYRELFAGVRFLLIAQADESEHEAAEHHGLTRSRAVMICSASIGEGKTETAANLAVAAARVGLRTVLVDADLRRPAVAKQFGLGHTTGLSDALLNGEPADAHTVDVGVDDLRVLPAGRIAPNPADLLASPAMRAMQQVLLRKYDLVVIDTPPVLAVADALEIGPFVDLTVLVARVGQTSRRQFGVAMERLGHVGATVGGTVLNGLDRALDGYYAYEETAGKKGRRDRHQDRQASERNPANGTNDAHANGARTASSGPKSATPDPSAGDGLPQESPGQRRRTRHVEGASQTQRTSARRRTKPGEPLADHPQSDRKG